MKETEMMAFAEAVKKSVQKQLGGGYGITFKKVEKNNGVELLAMCIHKTGSRTNAVIYMKDYLELYMGGMELSHIADGIVKRFCEKADVDFEIGQIYDYEKAKELLMVKVINTEKNRSFLENVPHEEFLNLSVIPVLRWLDEKGDCGTITVKRPFIDLWGVAEEELLLQAKANTQRIEPYKLCSLEEIMKKYCLSEGITGEVSPPILILSNRMQYLGAAAVLCPQALREAWEKFERKDFYVLPSSIHETLLVPAEDSMTVEEIRDMVRSINKTKVDEEEFLSDDIYVYRGECGKMEMVKANEA